MRRAQFGSVGHDLVRLFGEGTVAGLSEGDLLRRYLDRRDEVAFGAIVARHGPMVMGVCRRVLRDSGDVEDAFQVTFLTLAKKAGTLKRDDPVGHWLYGVAYRVALRARTASARRRLREGSGPIPEVAMIDAPSDRELGSLIDAELARLPSKYRAPIVLCYVEGLTHEEASQELGWPVGTVKGRLSRARDLLKGRLSRRGAAPSAGAALPGFLRTSGASVPGSLAGRTTRAALEIAAGSTAGMVSASTAALFHEGIWAMFLTKMKVAGAVFLTLAASVAVLGYQGADEPGARSIGEPAALGGQDPQAEANSGDSPEPEIPTLPADVEAQPPVIPEAEEPSPPAEVEAVSVEVAPVDSPEPPSNWIAQLAEPDTSPMGQAILEVLEKPVAMNFPNETPLEDFLRYLKESTKSPEFPAGIPIYVDPQGLQDAEKTMASTISMDLDGVPIKTTLRLALKQLGLIYDVKNGMMYITSSNSEDHPSPLALAIEKADRGELTLEQYQELIQILGLQNEIAKLRQEKDKLDMRGGGIQ
ncbi:sigma-70 family RNA polymerase sigma factor [Tundrisphaera lichenicola]|uniref:RNA polymerase sigma factor n=1 Tax=Tundrisphaera lichenicola TaxID=2029860 RepID=UPI003EBA5DF8